ncbi:hypothetical protein KIL84_012198 [Mauremys mutica]|uniref:Uncharacterized protein n=1 Tax=Mauremys mutica TaxID=74926 RepID=A0A9D3XF35_9SAUR|nr:hypothetical protein KIL84_012198 [Mauremys mutica]
MAEIKHWLGNRSTPSPPSVPLTPAPLTLAPSSCASHPCTVPLGPNTCTTLLCLPGETDLESQSALLSSLSPSRRMTCQAKRCQGSAPFKHGSPAIVFPLNASTWRTVDATKKQGMLS